MSYKLLCTDIDGTLLNKERELSSETIKQVKRINNVCEVVLASSRMPKAMRHLQTSLGILNNPIIAYNGGLLLDGNGVLDSVEIDTEIIEDINRFNISQKKQVHISIYNNDDWYVPSMDYWAEREQKNTKVDPIVKDIDKVILYLKRALKGAHKIMCMGAEEDINNMYEWLELNYSSKIHLYRSKPAYIEIANKLISKESAIQKLLKVKYHNISMTDIIAFGDNYNDIGMLESVGLGVAVENSLVEVKESADEVTLSNVMDGVAHSIKRHFKHV